MSFIEQKCDGIILNKFIGNTEGFLAETSNYKLLGSLYIKMLCVDDYSKAVGEIDCKGGTSLGVY